MHKAIIRICNICETNVRVSRNCKGGILNAVQRMKYSIHVPRKTVLSLAWGTCACSLLEGSKLTYTANHIIRLCKCKINV